MKGSVRPSSVLALLAVAWLAAACAPTCDRTCRKLDSCAADGSTVTRIECEDQCLGLIQSHDDVNDDVRKELFAAHRRCVIGATCDELEDGVCYEEELYAY